MPKRSGLAVKAGPSQITAWSYSRWRDYNECPQKAKFKYLDRLPDPGGPALVRGSKIHDECEQYLLGNGEITEAMEDFAEEFEELRELKAVPELERAFTSTWEPTGWVAKDTWCRVKLDAQVVLSKTKSRVIDFKTGRLRQIDEAQVQLYALSEFLVRPTVKEVKVELFYLDEDQIKEQVYKRAQMKSITASWNRKVSSMLKDTKFEAAPSQHACRFCPFSPKKGGQCQVGM
jgi:CRISPR/Cas system-associated exonuclease Cas4 (RecB family)